MQTMQAKMGRIGLETGFPQVRERVDERPWKRFIHCRFCDWKKPVKVVKRVKTTGKVKVIATWSWLYTHVMREHHSAFEDILAFARPDWNGSYDGRSTPTTGGRGLAYYEPRHELWNAGLVRLPTDHVAENLQETWALAWDE